MGDYTAYSDALAATNTNQAQQRHVVAVVQASGSGKTRLAFADGMDSRLVILARIWKQKQAYTPGWSAYIALAQHWASVMPLLAGDDRRRVSQAALSAMRLLVASHASFVASMIERAIAMAPDGSSIKLSPHSASDESARIRREVALRCLRNGRGDAAVADIFLAHLDALATRQQLDAASGSAVDASVSVLLLNRDAVDAFCCSEDVRLRGLLWPGAEVAFWYDEAHSLIGTPKVFAPHSAFVARQPTPVDQLQDCLYGLTALCSDFTDKHRWLQSLCGTWLELSTRVNLPNVSPLRGRVTNVFHASRIEAADMIRVLRRFFAIDDATATALLPLLEQLRGRPIFFFDDMLTSLWAKLTSAWLVPPAPSIDANGLRAILLSAAEVAIQRGQERMASIVRELWFHKPAVLKSGRSTRTLCAELFAAVKMNGGVITLGSDAGSEALERGLLAMPLQATDQSAALRAAGLTVDMREEPLTMRAIERVGNVAVNDSRIDPDDDPIFQLLGESMAHGHVAGFSLTTSVKGDVLELAFAWHVIRTVLLTGTGRAGPGPSLAAVLAPLAAPGIDMPSRTRAVFVVASRGLAGQQLEPRMPTQLHALASSAGARSVVFDIDEDAGVDVAFDVVDTSLAPVSAVFTQAKAKRKAGLADCARAASPGWQYTTAPQRRLVLSKCQPLTPTAKRVAFEALAAATASEPIFSTAFRLVLSASGYHHSIARMCNDANAAGGACEGSPIVALQPSAAAFGKRLSEQLHASCAGGKPLSGTKQIAFVWPHSACAVSSAQLHGAAAPQAVPSAPNT